MYLVSNLAKLSVPFYTRNVQFKYEKVSLLSKKPQYKFEDMNILTCLCLCFKITIQSQPRTLEY